MKEQELENSFVNYLKLLNYTPIQLDEDSLYTNFRNLLYLINSDDLDNKPLTDQEFKQLLIYLDKNVYNCASILRDKYTLKRDDGEVVYLHFLYNDNSKNIYQVANQITTVGSRENRYDVTLLINGLPLIQIELKKPGVAISEAFNQVERYRRDSYRGLFNFIQLFVISNGVDTKYYANSDYKIYPAFTFFWTDLNNNKYSELHDFAKQFLSHKNITEVLTEYMILNSDKQLMVMRPYQIYAVKAIMSSVTSKLNSPLDSIEKRHQGGFIWAATGSGKTLTSFKTSQLLAENPNIKKVIFLVDRNDLDSQTLDEFNRFNKGYVDDTNSTYTLTKLLKDPNKKLIITTIQKMASALNNIKYTTILDEFKQENVIFIIDECHRSQFGKMNTDIKRHFEKSLFFGFTGTPIFDLNKGKDRSTEDVFGKCLHTYLLRDAIADKNVLPFQVEYIKTYNLPNTEQTKTKKQKIDMNELLLAPERIELVVNHVLQYYHKKTNANKYNAIFACDSIPALLKYYQAFKDYNNDLRVAAIFSFTQNEDIEDKDISTMDAMQLVMNDYNALYGTDYNTSNYHAYNVNVSKRLKSKEIDILLVVDMYLTGFDSKLLNTLYVDKNLKYHTLIQAFSRTNRIEKSLKSAGNIVCFRPLKAEVDEAVRLFSNTVNPSDVVLDDYSEVYKKLKASIVSLRHFVPFPKSVDSLISESDEKEFIELFLKFMKNYRTMDTFVGFNMIVEEPKLGITRDEIDAYKSKYLDIAEFRRKPGAKKSILNDVDFQLDLISTDTINVDYILSLISRLTTLDPNAKEDEVKKLIEELAKTDNKELRQKADVVLNFIHHAKGLTLTNDLNIEEEYKKFEVASKIKEIDSYIEKHVLIKEKVYLLLDRYSRSNIIDPSDKKACIPLGFTFKEKAMKSNGLVDFIENLNTKYGGVTFNI